MASNTSIHPRVENGRTRFPKVNTCGKASEAKRQRVIAALEGHCERHPNDGVSAKRLASLSAA